MGKPSYRKSTKKQGITGYSYRLADLDKVLDGGLPRGAVTEIIGKPTSGMTTLALKTMATAQSEGDVVVYVDLASAFDPDYAIRCGLNPMDIVLTRHEFSVALEVLADVVSSGLAGMVVFNTFPKLLSEQRGKLMTVISRLRPLLAPSRCALLILTQPYPLGGQRQHPTTLRLLVTLEKWLHQGQDIHGYQAQVTVLSRSFGSEGQHVHIQIAFEDR